MIYLSLIDSDDPFYSLYSEFLRIPNEIDRLEWLKKMKISYKYFPNPENEQEPKLLQFLLELEKEYFLDNDKETISKPNKKYNLKWNDQYSQNDFLELCKALFEAKAINGTQKDIIIALSELLNIEIKNPDQQLQSLKKSRNNDTQTKFLNKLKESYENWIDKAK